MSESQGLETPRVVRSIWPPLVLLVIAIAIFSIAQGYSEISRRFPVMVSVILIVLAIIDLYSRSNLPGRNLINTFWGSGFERREMTHNPSWRDEVMLLGWVVAAFAGMALLGILIAAPLFSFLFAWLRTKRPLGHAAIVGGIVLAFEFAVFEWALDYQLYRGLIISGEGLSAW